jgi:hypothetical protein
MRKDQASACVAMAAPLGFESGMKRTFDSAGTLDWRFGFTNGGCQEEHASADRAMASMAWAYLMRVWHGEMKHAGDKLVRMARRDRLELTTGELMTVLRERRGCTPNSRLQPMAGRAMAGAPKSHPRRG